MNSNRSRRKVAFIGASLKFVHQAIQDFIICGVLEDTDCYLYDIDHSVLKLECDFINKMLKQLNSAITVQRCDSRKAALIDADYIVTSLLVGGMEIAEAEDNICRKYGIRHNVGDTVGPMCAARCLRMVPLMLDIAADMKKYCPDAYLLSPTNPMAVTMGAVARYSEIKCVGICHGTHFLVQTIAKAYHVDHSQVYVNIVGVNHLGFANKVVIAGEEIPVSEVIKTIKDVANAGFDDPAGHQDRYMLAMDFAERTGIMPNNGDHHFIEFFPWFLSSWGKGDNGENRYGVDDLMHDPAKRRKIKADAEAKLRKLTYEEEIIPGIDKFSGEHINDIILGLEGREAEMTIKNLHLNILNGESVPNLPQNALLALTVRFEHGKISGVKNPPVDSFLFGLLAPLIAENDLITEATVKRDKSLFVKALHLDPLVNDFAGIPKLADELWAINEQFIIPQK